MSGNASVAVARVSKSFGSEGELLVSLFDTFPDDFDLREPLFVEIDRLAVPLFCDRFERRGRNGALVVFADFYSERRTAELIGRELFLCGGRLADGEKPPGDGLVYLEDLVGLEASVGDAYGDLKPALDRSKLADRIAREIGSLGPQAEIRQLLRRLLPPQLIPLAAATCRLSPSQLLASLDKRDGERIASVLKSLRIPVSDYRPFSEAIVTAGGVSTEEVDPETMQSRLVGGLYLAGELLDIDADTGGYNLQIAYSTGHLAGELLASQSI